MKLITILLTSSILLAQPNEDWELPIAINDYGWFPTNFTCLNQYGNSCGGFSSEFSCENVGCNWVNIECGGIYGGVEIDGTCYGLSDTISIGMSDSAQFGFEYGVDLFNMSPSMNMAPYIDGFFYHPDWFGSFWVNSIGDTIYCSTMHFNSDIRNFPDVAYIMEWAIEASIMEIPSWMNYRLSWPEIILPEEFDIFLYLYNEDFTGYLSYNMREIDFKTVSGSYLMHNSNSNSRIIIRIGQCLEDGVGEYYQDNDGDGLGFGNINWLCEEFLPEGFVDNNIDENDEIYCINNNFDECNICNGDGWSCTSIGDVNQDYEINISDIVIIVEHLLNISILEGTAYTNADFNVNGNVNIADIVGIIQYIFNSSE